MALQSDPRIALDGARLETTPGDARSFRAV
jgi:hypothetical protein